MNDVVEVAEQVFLVRGSNVNWYLLRDGTDLTLVDAGYPGDLDRVEESVRSLGRRPEDIRAILLTHAHVDHMGAINAFHDRYGSPVLMDAVEVPHYRRRVYLFSGAADLYRGMTVGVCGLTSEPACFPRSCWAAGQLGSWAAEVD